MTPLLTRPPARPSGAAPTSPTTSPPHSVGDAAPYPTPHARPAPRACMNSPPRPRLCHALSPVPSTSPLVALSPAPPRPRRFSLLFCFACGVKLDQPGLRRSSACLLFSSAFLGTLMQPPSWAAAALLPPPFCFSHLAAWQPRCSPPTPPAHAPTSHRLLIVPPSLHAAPHPPQCTFRKRVCPAL